MNAYEAKLLGVITALEFTQQFKWLNLWFECDSTYVVELLCTRSKEVPWNWHAVPYSKLS